MSAKDAVIQIGCVVMSLVVNRWFIVTPVYCDQTVHHKPIVTTKQ